MKTSAARRPDAFLTKCHAYSTWPLNFSHFSLRLDCSSVWRCIQAHFLPHSLEDGVVQSPFRPALRLRLFFKWTARTILPLEPFPPIFSFYHFVWNMRLLDSLFEIHSFCKSVRIPVDGLFRLFGILALLAQDWLWSRSPLCYGFLRTCLHWNFSRNRENPLNWAFLN